MSERTKVLLVRHGPGRGRFINYANAWVQQAERHRPELYRRLVVHETGGPELSLDGVGAVVFLLADPLRERYPACYEEAARIAARAAERGLRIANPPDALSNTIKTVQASRWQAAGVPCAACVPYASRAEFDAAIVRVPFPAIVRPDLLHAQQFTFRCATRDDAAALTAQQLQYPGLVVQFIDTRAGWDKVAPGSVWERYYHRCRAYVFGDRVYSQAIYFSEDPIVASETATFQRYKGWGMLLSPLLRLRPLVHRTVVEDIRYADGPPEQPELLVRAVRALGLDFAAVDYARRADGSLVFWEANPHPAMPVWRHVALPVARRLRRRWGTIHRAALTFLDGMA
jgi:glutathione synthase/RimK-type ligase-like ATP-grasp enzyme